MKYFKVQTGFGPDDFVQIDETELEMCVKAQITGKVAITKEGTISGNIIQKITPDWNRVLGYQRLYKLQGEDYRELGERRVEEYRIHLDTVNRKAQGLPPAPDREELGPGVKQLSDQFKIKP